MDMDMDRKFHIHGNPAHLPISVIEQVSSASKSVHKKSWNPGSMPFTHTPWHTMGPYTSEGPLEWVF